MSTGAQPDMPTHPEETRTRAPVQTSNAITLPEIVRRAGTAEVFAAGEFFYGTIRNQHTRVGLQTRGHQFLAARAAGSRAGPSRAE